jgi:DNA-binding winged helix-turn-helix (wHTH) protein
MSGLAFKGFAYSEVLAKCGMVHTLDDMVINFSKLTFTKAGKPVKLTKNEWKYLAVIISFAGETCNRQTLYRMVVGMDGGTTRTVDTFIAMLRHKLGMHIETVHGLGYRWVVTPTAGKPDARYHDQNAPRETKAGKPVKRKPATKREKPAKKATVVTKMLAPIPLKRATPMAVKNVPPPPESPERIYRIRGTFVQWDGTGEMPHTIAAYQQAHGDTPSFITLPIGKIWFTVTNNRVVVYSGKGALPGEVLDYLDENKTLPPWIQHRVSKPERSKRAA